MCLAILFVTVASGWRLGAADEPWQNDWTKYVDEIGKYVASGGHPSAPPFEKQFEGKVVTWQGSLRRVDALKDGRYVVRMNMPPREIEVPLSLFPGALSPQNKTKMTLQSLDVRPSPGTEEAWKQVPQGTVVRFRAKSGLVVPITAQNSGLFIIDASDGEPLGGRAAPK